MVKTALLGAINPHSLGHLRTLQALPEVESIFVWDEDELALKSLLEDKGDKVAGAFTDLDALLSREDITFVVAASRTDLCPGICLRALDAGKHVLAEKPLGRTASDAERVVKAAEEAGLMLGVFYTNRSHPIVRRARALIDQGVIGPLMSVEMRWITTQVKRRDPKHWLFNKAYAGGGILAWLGCHYVDMMRYVTGDEIISVAAEVATRSGEDIDVEDIATVALRFRSGAVGSLHGGYVLALSGGGFYNRAGNDTYVAFNGQTGRLYWKPTSTRLCLHVESTEESWRDAPIWEFTLPGMPESPAYGGVHGESFVSDFIRAAQGEGHVVASGRDALQVARVVDAAYESSRTGRRVDVALPRGKGEL